MDKRNGKVDFNKNNPTELWKTIKKLLKRKVKTRTKRVYIEDIINRIESVIAEKFNNYLIKGIEIIITKNSFKFTCDRFSFLKHKIYGSNV